MLHALVAAGLSGRARCDALVLHMQLLLGIIGPALAARWSFPLPPRQRQQRRPGSWWRGRCAALADASNRKLHAIMGHGMEPALQVMLYVWLAAMSWAVAQFLG